MSRTPRLPILPRDHVYSSTAPLPYLPTFLGSPFSTKTARGRYTYDTASSSRGPMTEQVGQEIFGNSGLDWTGKTERNAEEITQDETGSEPQAANEDSPVRPSHTSSRTRHGTSSSASSLDDFSGSGESSASLPSLGRNSCDYHARPSVISIWGEGREDLNAEDFDPTTPSRQPFLLRREQEDGLLMSAKTAHRSPFHSPFIMKRATPASPSERLSPLHHFLLAQGVTDRTPPSCLSPSSHCSVVSNFTPRLLLSAKTDVGLRLNAKQTRSRSPRSPIETPIDLEAEMTDTEENAPDRKRPSGRLYGNPNAASLGGDGRVDSSSEIGIGLGILVSEEGSRHEPVRHTERSKPFSRSLSSESSTDIDPSPSKFLSARASASRRSPVLPSTCLDEIRRNSLAAYINTPTTSTQLVDSLPPCSVRPVLRRGITEPRAANEHDTNTSTNWLSSVYTPSADIIPSPAAFASTGLLKKKSGITGFEIPKFGQSLDLAKSRVVVSTKAPARVDAKHTSYYVKAAQQARGLRRKGSALFASGSSGSIGKAADVECATSPATPTKLAPKCEVFPELPSELTAEEVPGNGLGLTTPSPTTSAHVSYPFAASISPKALEISPSTESATSCDDLKPSTGYRMKVFPAYLREARNHGGPVARGSNPMLTATFHSHGSVAPLTLSMPQKGTAGRLEKDFTIVQSVGTGEFSHVWKVRDKHEGRFWAVKAGKPYTGQKNRYVHIILVSGD